jgi:hypothetical protein
MAVRHVFNSNLLCLTVLSMIQRRPGVARLGNAWRARGLLEITGSDTSHGGTPCVQQSHFFYFTVLSRFRRYQAVRW